MIAKRKKNRQKGIKTNLIFNIYLVDRLTNCNTRASVYKDKYYNICL